MNAAEYTAVPDLDTFAVLPWDTRFARVFCRLYEPDHLAEDAGAEYACDFRGSLQRVHPGSPSAPASRCAPAASRR